MNLQRFFSAGMALGGLVVATALSGCGKGDSGAPAGGASTATSAVAAAASRPMGDADLLAGVPVGGGATNQEMSQAEQDWMTLLMAMRPPREPEEWATNKPTKEVLTAFRRKVGESFADTALKAEAFYTKYPKHEKAAEAKDRELALLNASVQLGHTNVETRLGSLEASRLKDPSVSEEERLQLRLQQVQRAAFRRGGEDMGIVLAELEKGARELRKEFPKQPETLRMMLEVAENWLDRGEVDRAKTVATEVAAANPDEELKKGADSVLKKIGRVGKPLELKFTAVDGRAVDLQAMKGKVVLVDFWATWCGPCIQELPNVKAAYTKLQPKGFEIVAISLDHEKEALLEFIKTEGLAWPQFFDDASERNRFAEEFEIRGIPTMWLVDKKGNLRYLSAREDLVAKVEKLLAE